MIAEVAIVVIGALFGWEVYHNRKERRKLLEMIMAKNLTDLKAGEAIESNNTGKPETEETPPEFSPVETASDGTFEKAIKKV